MDNADQVIVHVNSHGSVSQATLMEANNKFTNFTRKPINNINKLGLLYASFPRVYENVDENHN